MKLYQNYWGGFIFIVGLAVFIGAILAHVPYTNFLGAVGVEILQASPETLPNKPNIVGAVLYHFRGLDTLGELTVLFTAVTGAGVILGRPKTEGLVTAPSGFILYTAVDLLFPLLILFGFYIVLFGDVIPGGLFQAGALLAAAFFIPILATPAAALNEKMAFMEGAVGSLLMILGLLTLVSRGAFLEATFGHFLGHIFWETALLLLHLAIALKIGMALGGLLARFAEFEEQS